MANSNDQRILELAGKATLRPWVKDADVPALINGPNDSCVAGNYDYSCGGIIREEDADYICAAANCAPDLVRRIAALRAALEELELHGDIPRYMSIGIGDVLQTDDTACAAMKVGDE